MDSIPVSKDKTPEEKLEQIINYLSLCDDNVAIEFIDLSSKTKNNLLQIINPFGNYLKSQAKTEKNIERMQSVLTELNARLHKIESSTNDLYYKAKSLLNKNTIDNSVKLEVANIYQLIAELNKAFNKTYYFVGDYSDPLYKKTDIKFLEQIRDNINWFLEDFTGLDGIYSDLIGYMQFDIFDWKNNRINEESLLLFINSVISLRNQFEEIKIELKPIIDLYKENAYYKKEEEQ